MRISVIGSYSQRINSRPRASKNRVKEKEASKKKRWRPLARSVCHENLSSACYARDCVLRSAISRFSTILRLPASILTCSISLFAFLVKFFSLSSTGYFNVSVFFFVCLNFSLLPSRRAFLFPTSRSLQFAPSPRVARCVASSRRAIRNVPLPHSLIISRPKSPQERVLEC